MIEIADETIFEKKGIVLITAGGTSVPIDPVRSIENFSTGLRGARLAEYFAKENFKIYMYNIFKYFLYISNI